MNIFEDLIEELKEENLLEETVIKTAESKDKSALRDKKTQAETVSETIAQDSETANQENENLNKSEAETSAPAESQAAVNNPAVFKSATKISEQPQSNETEFYRKRAMEEVSFLQMVEYVFAGVEREQMKIEPKPYDDLEAKKILHAFLQISGSANSPEHAQLEFQLLQETENWYSALSRRDKRISVANLRRYCETTRPALSAPALVSLGRFYRNSPFSEPVRSKFDLILTRLFSRDAGGEKRELTARREDLIKQLNALYANWSSIPLYSIEDEDNSEILLIALKFEDFMAEAESATDFDELVRNDFFNRLRIFKESAQEQFFAPLVTAAAIESNVRIGNRFVELLAQEREKGASAALKDKYGFLHDQVISDTTSKTVQLVELLKEKTSKPEPSAQQPEKALQTEKADYKIEAKSEKTETSEKKNEPKKKGFITFFGVNKGLLAATILAVVFSVGLYVWAEYQTKGEAVSQNVKKVNLDNSMLKDFIKEARISDETFYAVVQSSWGGMNREKKEEILKKIVSIGAEKGFKNVHLLDKEGKTAGSASKEKINIGY